jgi:hypothetical protein
VHLCDRRESGLARFSINDQVRHYVVFKFQHLDILCKRLLILFRIKREVRW